jgi:hypothetical protein
MKTLTLSVLQRGILMPLLPQSGRRLEMIIINSITKQIEFTENDIEKFELRYNAAGLMVGNPKKFVDIELALTNEQIAMLREIPGRIDSAGQVTQDMLPLLDKIDALSAS